MSRYRTDRIIKKKKKKKKQSFNGIKQGRTTALLDHWLSLIFSFIVCANILSAVV